ncbi:MAG TPA: spore coat protein CotJB [Clostridiaceae bacterium]|nr:spore coat protein CotJB [Clostridiaceae bacterium]
MVKEREKLLREIMAYDFAAIDMQLYLNTHPHDVRAISLHNCYVNRSRILKDMYERLYGPLTASSPYPRYPWKWIESPWPWEYQ